MFESRRTVVRGRLRLVCTTHQLPNRHDDNLQIRKTVRRSTASTAQLGAKQSNCSRRNRFRLHYLCGGAQSVLLAQTETTCLPIENGRKVTATQTPDPLRRQFVSVIGLNLND